MPSNRENIAQWENRLRDAFRGPNGIVGERATGLHAIEHEIALQGLREFGGYINLADSFFDFALECLDLLRVPPSTYHVLRAPLLVASVSRLRSSYVIFWKGYNFDAASLLRGVFENALTLCADARGVARLDARFDWSGIDLSGDRVDVMRQMNKRRRPLDQQIRSFMIGRDSGLTQSDQDALTSLLNVMHAHVHNTEMHLVHLVTSVRETRLPADITPRWDALRASHFAHVSMFIAWAFTRLLAYAVPLKQRDAVWQRRFAVLDESFLFWFENFDKPLAGAVQRLITAKFTLPGEWPAPPPAH